MTVENTATGEKTIKPYNSLYSLIPTQPHENLMKADLATAESNHLLDVDH